MAIQINTADVKRSGDTMTGALVNTATTGNTLVWDTTTLVVDATNDRVGIGTASPSYPLSVTGSSGGFIAQFSDGTRQARFYGASGFVGLGSSVSGDDWKFFTDNNSGRGVAIKNTTGNFIVGDTTVGVPSESNYKLDIRAIGSNGAMRVGGTYVASSGTEYGMRVTPTITQSGTAGYRAIQADVTESSVGSAARYLFLGATGGVDKFGVQSSGLVNINSTDASTLILNGTGTANTVLRFQDDGAEIGALLSLNASTTLTLRSQADLVLTSTNAGTSRSLTLGTSALTFGDTINIAVSGTTGTKIGTATSQKLGIWNATPIVQPTTAVAAATFVANTSAIANDTATFDGYTIGQVVKALRNIGLLA